MIATGPCAALKSAAVALYALPEHRYELAVDELAGATRPYRKSLCWHIDLSAFYVAEGVPILVCRHWWVRQVGERGGEMTAFLGCIPMTAGIKDADPDIVRLFSRMDQWVLLVTRLTFVDAVVSGDITDGWPAFPSRSG